MRKNARLSTGHQLSARDRRAQRSAILITANIYAQEIPASVKETVALNQAIRAVIFRVNTSETTSFKAWGAGFESRPRRFK